MLSVVAPQPADEDEEEDHHTTTDRSVRCQLELDDEGRPLLPVIEMQSLPKIKRIVRSFITLHYRELSILL